MHVIIISESLIIRKGIEGILEKEEIVDYINCSYVFSDINKKNYDLLILDLNKNNIQYLEYIKYIKQRTETKVIVLDFFEDSSIFSKCMKIGVDGYISSNIDSRDISYIVKQINRGKKYYESELIEKYFSKRKQDYLDELTKREQEILTFIAMGNSNNQISKSLFITQHTVKKHTSNILQKLNLRDRRQITLYAHSKGLV